MFVDPTKDLSCYRQCKKCADIKLITDFYTNHHVCKACVIIRVNNWRRANPDKLKKHQRDKRYRDKQKGYHNSREFKQKSSLWKKQQNLKTNLLVFDHYGNKCTCCSVQTYEFLTLDHIYNNGAEHRKTISTTYIKRWIKTNNFPKDIQILCYNCNFCKAHQGTCYHISGYRRTLDDFSKNYRRFARVRLEVVDYYGNCCFCCGIDYEAFLSVIDPTRKQSTMHTSGWYYFIKRNNYPSSYQVLCYNCQRAIQYYQVCPHRELKREIPCQSLIQ